MSQARYTKNGLLIPKEWVDELGENISVKKGKDFVIIESKQRLSARKNMAKMVSKLREASANLGQLDENEIDSIVKDVKKVRASNY